MSTRVSTTFPETDIDIRHSFQCFLTALAGDPDLLRPEQLSSRLTVLDELDMISSNMTASEAAWEAQILTRLWEVRTRLEAANQELYEDARSEIVREGESRLLRLWLLGEASEKCPPGGRRGLSFDVRDEIVSGALQLREPRGADLPQSWEMLPYQPTPARHILDLIATVKLSANDRLVDLGSGLGHVPLLVSILTGVQTLGIEFQPAYVATAQECAQSLRIRQARFVSGDARLADLSSGTVFYLYSPFAGSILIDVLSRLRKESTDRQIRICSLGPCTRRLKDEAWLQADSLTETERIAVFHSQSAHRR